MSIAAHDSLWFISGFLALVIAMLSQEVHAGRQGFAVWDMDVPFQSSEDPSLTLYLDAVKKDDVPRPLMLYLHTWQGSRFQMVRDVGSGTWWHDKFFIIGVSMRGRGSQGKPASQGKADCGGWELQDLIDGAIFAQKEYAGLIPVRGPVYAMGHSGGCGNVMSIAGKFPDFFTALCGGSGMADYARWYRESPGYRATMAERIGGSPDDVQEAYAGRSGITTVENLLTPMYLVHGAQDKAVPHRLTGIYADRANELGKTIRYELWEDVEHGAWGHYDKMAAFMLRCHRPPEIPATGRFVVAGYLKTRKFEIILPSIDAVGRVQYSLQGPQRFSITCDRKGTVRLRVPSDPGTSISITGPRGRAIPAIVAPRADAWEIAFPHEGESVVEIGDRP